MECLMCDAEMALAEYMISNDRKGTTYRCPRCGFSISLWSERMRSEKLLSEDGLMHDYGTMHDVAGLLNEIFEKACKRVNPGPQVTPFDEDTIKERSALFARNIVKTDPDLLVVHETCPLCGSNEIGYDVALKTWDCHRCGEHWKAIRR